MKIEKYVKKKNNSYEIIFDNEQKIILHENIILKYELLLKDSIERELIEKAVLENNKYLAYDKALKYLSIRQRSISEVIKQLRKFDYNNNDIEYVINLLKNDGYLNDEVFAKSFINDRINLTNHGPYKIKKDLTSLGVSSEIIENTLEIFNTDLQIERITNLIEKNQKKSFTSTSTSLKYRLEKLLITLGYEKSIVYDVLNSYDFDESEQMKKEYDKLFQKYSKKYSGLKLELFIKQKLFQKGYRSFEE